jgi:hypothetical protein
MMKQARIPNGLALVTAVLALAGAVLSIPNLAHAQSKPSPVAVRGAPGPIAGAGLPILAVGYAVYWLVKRRRKAE